MRMKNKSSDGGTMRPLKIYSNKAATAMPLCKDLVDLRCKSVVTFLLLEGVTT